MRIESKLIEMSEATCRRHDMCLRVPAPMLDTAGTGLNLSDHEDAALEWMLLESLATILGQRTGLSARLTAEQVERMAERILNGATSDD